PYCQYAFRFDRGQEHLVVKQYTKGALQIQGSAGGLYREVLTAIVPQYNVRYPNAQLSIDALFAEAGGGAQRASGVERHSIPSVPLPHIGTDESGKGDYFGPMVIAGV